MKTDELIAIARSMDDYVFGIRRILHQKPETRWETEETRNLIITEASIMGYEIKALDGGIVVDVYAPNCTNTTEWLLFRADFDALPVPEKTGILFTSKIEGKSHACGHDIHVAMLLGAMRAISEGLVKPTKNLRFVFQDAEENPGTAPRLESGGSVLVNEEGVCDGISKAYALHIRNMPDSTFGAFHSRPGAVTGNSGRLYFKIESSGGHVAKPHTGVNALRVVNAVMNRLDTFLARHMDPLQPATLEPAIVNSGKGSNVMPAEAEIWYGFRTLLPRDEHIKMAETIWLEVTAVAESMNAKVADFKLIHGHPAQINDLATYERAVQLLKGANESVVEMDPSMGGEDFAYYSMKVPSAMFMLGAYGPNSTGDHHSPTFNPDASVFWRGVHFWLLLATGN